MAPARRAPDLDVALEVARSKVSSLEAALAAMGNHHCPEVDALRSALLKAKQAAQERPLKTQLAHTDAFIERSRLRIQKLAGKVARADCCRAKCRYTQPHPIQGTSW